MHLYHSIHCENSWMSAESAFSDKRQKQMSCMTDVKGNKIFKKLSFNGISNTTFKIDVGVSTESFDALQHQISAQISRVKSGEGDAISVSGKRSDLSIIGLKIFISL